MEFAYFINRWGLSREISGMLQSLSTGCLKGPAILVCKRRNPSFLCLRHPVKSHRPHMINDDILLRPVQPEVLPCITVCRPRMGQSMKMIPRLRGMGMPVIQEQIMEHPRPGRRSRIQTEQAAKPVIIIGNIQTMPVTGSFPVMLVFLHALYHRMPGNISDLLEEFSSPSPAKPPHPPYSLHTGNLYFTHLSALLTFHSILP